MAEKIIRKKAKFQPGEFSEREIAMFISTCCGSMISVSTNTVDPNSPFWVNIIILSNFIKLHHYYWNHDVRAHKPIAVEQRDLLSKILSNITYIVQMALRHNCFINQWVDLRKLLMETSTNKMINLYLFTNKHHEYDVLEIEKISLAQAKIELSHDIADEILIKELIIFSRFMALQLHGLNIS
jgi:hypothetical protein